MDKLFHLRSSRSHRLNLLSLSVFLLCACNGDLLSPETNSSSNQDQGQYQIPQLPEDGEEGEGDRCTLECRVNGEGFTFQLIVDGEVVQSGDSDSVDALPPMCQDRPIPVCDEDEDFEELEE